MTEKIENLSPTQRALRARELGHTGVQAFPGTYEGNRLELEAGGEHELPAVTQHSNKSKAEKAAEYIRDNLESEKGEN